MRLADLATPAAIAVMVVLGWSAVAIERPWYWLGAIAAAALAGLITWLYGQTRYRHGILDEMLRDRHFEPDEDTPTDGYT